MTATRLAPNLYLLRLSGWQAYLWRDEDGITLVDTGPAGSGDALMAALDEIGAARSQIRRIVLTHFHDDHAGGAAEIAKWGDVEVIAHQREAPIIRGEQPGPPPNFTEAELALHAQVAHDLPAAPPCRVDREVVDGDVLDIAGGALVVATPGHSDGSLALYLRTPRVLFTGDTIAEHDGQVMLGVFNLDRERTAESFRQLAQFESDIACFGHGRPILSDARQVLLQAQPAG
jgi:glyoxylase-like metal-dependent hydrolase (beta-lactamase superfamily II)